MSVLGLFIILGVFIALIIVYRNAGRFIKKLPPKTVKTVNWIAFTEAALSGVAWFIFNDVIFMFLCFAGVVVYFLFYDYDKTEEPEHKSV
ncbi:hypothetical protein EPN18_04740 [bacterium]|nr:MAG: hypothetical protein EPN18_04740 [bacterium]